VWDFYARRLDVLKDARPNAAHHALAGLERDGFVEAVVTQNIDRLHELATSQNVIEVHGSIRTSSCLACGERASFDEVVRMLEQAPAPSCPRCGSILKPDVVMFGEFLPQDEIERASELAGRAGLLLVVGSSLNVYPVADLPRETRAAGGKIAIVNNEPTPFDDWAEVAIYAPAGETLSAARQHLEQVADLGQP
jgi:NAD-dependent deacetylase